MQGRKNAKLYQKLCEVISKSLDKNMQVLELACGTGQLTLPLCKKVAAWEATNFSVKMIGFHTFHKWKSNEYVEFVSKKGFDIIESSVIEGEMLPECILICKI